LTPTIRATLEAALSACKRDGSPDHAIHVQAARALMQLGETPTPDDPNPTVITNVVQEPRELLAAAWPRGRRAGERGQADLVLRRLGRVALPGERDDALPRHLGVPDRSRR